MMRRPLTLLILMMLHSPSYSQDCDDPDPAQMMASQQKMMSLMGPGPEHELLESLVGDWQATVTMHMPGMQAMQSSMTSTSELVLGGRFLKTISKGSMMGTPVESIGFIGYDRRHGRYTMIGFDTMGTYYITAAGEYDEATKSIRFHGTDDDPIMGVTQDYVFTMTFNEDGSNTMSLTFNCPTFGTGAPFEMVEYTSRKVEHED